MASATPDLRLPSQPYSITAVWLVPNCTEAYVCEQLAQGSYMKVESLGVQYSAINLKIQMQKMKKLENIIKQENITTIN